MSQIFAVGTDKSGLLLSYRYFTSLDKARQYLKKVANERKLQIGIRDLEETADSFSYIIGWKECLIVFRISTLEVED